MPLDASVERLYFEAIGDGSGAVKKPVGAIGFAAQVNGSQDSLSSIVLPTHIEEYQTVIVIAHSSPTRKDLSEVISMHCNPKTCFCIAITLVANLVKFTYAQTSALPDAPKQIQFYANHLKSNAQKIKTLKGELECIFRRPVDTAVFYHDLDIRVAGDFIQENSEVYTFTWDLATDNLVSIGVPSDKPCRYLDAKTNTELVPEQKSCQVGVELKKVINSQHAISTSREKHTEDYQHQIYERTQNPVHEMRGSPKQVFHWAHDHTFHSFLFAVAKQLQEEKESAGVCHLSIEKNLHTLDLIAKAKSGHPLTYKWVFDADRDFVLTKYETKIGELKNVTTHEWTYSSWDSVGPVPTRLTTTVVDKYGRRERIFELSKLVVNEKVVDSTFSLASLKPENGDILLDKETGDTFVIQDNGKQLVSTKPE